MFKLDINRNSILKKDVEKIEPQPCYIRQMTTEEIQKYKGIKPLDKHTQADYLAHVTENRRQN